MSKFLSERFNNLDEYVPGEQPKDQKYIKLNTNESPFPPSSLVKQAVENQVDLLMLYSDPQCYQLRKMLADRYNTQVDNVFVGNGSDEVLSLCFMAFCDRKKGMAFPQISYGFYPVYANLYSIDYNEVPLNDDFSINPCDYYNLDKNIVIANPNAPTGLVLSVKDIEGILINNKNNVVIIDEAYIDFGADSCNNLIGSYDNLIVVQTFSKSRSLAGGRLGFALANKQLIADLNKLKFSNNPYNVNSMTLAAGVASLKADSYYMENCKKIIDIRDYTKAKLESMGFYCTQSKANFIFVKNNKISGEIIYKRLKERSILVRHFNIDIIKDFVRITIGTKEQMDCLINALKDIIE